MELHHLRHFVAVAEELNFNRAAKTLRIAQPALSQSIKRLEASLGLELFVRSRRKVELTPAGKAFYDETKVTLIQVERSVAVAHRVRSGQSGQLTIGFATPVLFHILPRILKKFRKEAPDVEVRVEELSSEQQIDSLLSGEIDLALTFGLRSVPKEIKMLVIHQAEVAVAIPARWPLAKRRRIHLKDLKDMPLILVPRDRHPDFFDTLMTAFNQVGVSPRIVHSSTHTVTTLTLVAAELGIGLADATSKNFAFRAVTIVPVADAPKMPSILNVSAAWVPRAVSPALQHLLATIQSIVSES